MGKKSKANKLPMRLNLLFLITFVLFSALIFRLVMVQIVQGEEYVQQAEQETVQTVSVTAPRGIMMDRNGDIIVDNEPIYTVTYTERSDLDQDEWEIATRLAELIDMDLEDEVDENEMNEWLANYIEEEDVNVAALEETEEVDANREEVYEILKLMVEDDGVAPVRIKQDISTEEMFRISESMPALPGVEVIVDSDRYYVHDDLFRTYLGGVGDITSETVDEYLAQGYAMNEIVGLRGLEYQYEDQLRGIPSETEISLDRSLSPVGEPEHKPGQRGNDLVLTIDVELQQFLEERIEQEIEENENIPEDVSTDQPQFVAMDPNNGEVLAMSNNSWTYSHGAYFPGSVVKMASVLMGLHEGVVGPNTIIEDYRGAIDYGSFTPGSWRDLGSINAEQAIEQSSNIYMGRIGEMLMGQSTTTAALEAFEKVRDYNAQFGLGTLTGIDLPNESDGVHHTTDSPVGDLIQNMFGQHDHYTVLQLAQYAATLANDGYRMQPHLVKEIRRGVPNEEEISEVIWQKEPTVLNRVDMSDEHLAVAQRGMERVTQSSSGTANGLFGDFEVEVAAKTGTAQTGDSNYNNALFVGYAPADDPEIAFAALVPKSLQSQAENQQSGAQTISYDFLEYYFGLHEADDEDEDDQDDENNTDDADEQADDENHE